MTLAHPITQRRMESRYAVPLDLAARLEAELPQFTTPIEAVRGRPTTFLTAVYLDRPDLSLARAAALDLGQVEEIRSREEYSHEDSPVASLWIEWKARRETWSDQRRFALAKERFGQLCLGTLRWESVQVAQPLGEDISGMEGFRRVMSSARGVLLPRFAVTCRRRAFTITSPRIRVTLDCDIRFHEVPPSPYQGPGALSPRRLGRVFLSLPYAVLSVKTAGEIPSPLREIVRPLSRVSLSKFAIGARCILG